MGSYSEKKRFLAGAICPRCEAMDAIMVYSRGDSDFRECVECGFEDEMHFAPRGREPETRVNQTDEPEAAEPVKIIDFEPPGR